MLQDQRGEVGDDPDGLGDPPVEPGEPTEPTDPEPVEPPPDDPGEPPSDDPETVDDDDAPVPLKRFNKVYGEMKTQTEKFDLYKRLGPDKYYEVYPEEKPEEEPEELPEKPIATSEARSMVVRGGEYDGQTLEEVEAISPIDAQDLLISFRSEQKEEIDRNKSIQADADKEETDFMSEQAKAIYGKDFNDLTAIEQGKVDDVRKTVLTWMDKTGRGFANLFDGYHLMNRDTDIAAAKGDAAANAVNSISRGAVQSISGTKGSAQTGYGAYINLTRDQMADKLDSWSESEKANFYEKAPANVKNKFPELPW